MTDNYQEPGDKSEQLDQMDPEQSLVDRGVDDPLDEGYTTAENYSVETRIGDTETLDQRLAEEVPDDNLLPEEAAEQAADEDYVDDGEVGDVRAGRLVDPDEGLGPDVDSDLIGEDVGIDGAAASAEEAAVHVIGDDQV